MTGFVDREGDNQALDYHLSMWVSVYIHVTETNNVVHPIFPPIEWETSSRPSQRHVNHTDEY